jgi:hypothetical protein
MRSIVFATLIAAGLGLAGATTASAAPVNGAVINDTATATSGHVIKVQHWWERSRHWRHWHRHRCHFRHWSRWGWC